ncbi:hypothetical protein N5079_19660 [Planotetraspora sp. A-T 1434]|uniref:hypothetical protein n=1 Tax=Planotetraspora sp. A-T 1434 TaxID=2979219 RepID=UPI0021C23E20|nr:hypothetical protein [Planotetraspora sp. A-T 1434]MCT9932421.1 hypothetical protein [Planotetraspora sp. A-T 1434]
MRFLLDYLSSWYGTAPVVPVQVEEPLTEPIPAVPADPDPREVFADRQAEFMEQMRARVAAQQPYTTTYKLARVDVQAEERVLAQLAVLTADHGPWEAAKTVFHPNHERTT